MTLFDTRTARVLVTVLVFATAVAFIYAARRTLVLFLFAIFFAYLIEPLVGRAEAWARVSRGKAIAIVYLATFGGLILFLFLMGPRVAREGTKLAQSLPELYQKVSSGEIISQFGTRHGWSAETISKVQQYMPHKETVLRWTGHFAGRVAEIGSNVWWLAIIPILAVFFLKDGRKFSEDLLQLLERRRQQQFLRGVLEDINVMLAHFLRAQLTLAALSLIVYTAVLLLLRVPYAVLLGVIGGFLEFIPIVGPLVAAVLITGIALGAGYKHVFIVLLFLGAWRVAQDYYNSPRIMGKHVELHPLATLFGILVGAEMAGVVGVYLSIPAIATLRILWRRWRAYDTAQTLVAPSGEPPPAVTTEHAA